MKLLAVVFGVVAITACFGNAISRDDKSGTIGDLTWEYKEATHTLTISGEGNMIDKSGPNYFPWYNLRNEIANVNVQQGVTKIGNHAFSEIPSLSTVTIAESVNTIGVGAFSKCTGLKTMVIPPTVQAIMANAFSECISLTEITIPSSILTIEVGTFKKCGNLTSVTIESNLVSIGDYAFSGCSSLPNISLPSTVETIGNYSFSECRSLQSFTFSPSGSSLKTIGSFAFSESGLTSLTIPAGVESIKAGSFSSCTNLESIKVAKGNSKFASVDGVLFNLNKTILVQYPGGKKGSSYTVDSHVTNITSFAFEGCTNLLSVDILPGIKTIDSRAFFKCPSLTSVSIPQTVTSIGTNAFYQCKKLKRIDLPTNISTIYDYAFCSCDSLTSVVIPGNVTYVGYSAFGSCDSLISVEYLGTTDPNWLDSCFAESPRLISVCVPSDYKGGASFCGTRRFCKSDSCSTLLKNNNQCYGVDCSGDDPVISPNRIASEWMSKTSGCGMFLCDNETGMLSRLASCSSTLDNAMLCMDKACWEKDLILKDNLTVDMSLREPVYIDDFGLSNSIMTYNLQRLSGEDASNWKIAFKMNDEGNVSGLLVFVNGTDKVARVLAKNVTEMDRGKNCAYGIFCRVNNVTVLNGKSSSEDNSDESEGSDGSDDSNGSDDNNNINLAKAERESKTLLAAALSLTLIILSEYYSH